MKKISVAVNIGDIFERKLRIIRITVNLKKFYNGLYINGEHISDTWSSLEASNFYNEYNLNPWAWHQIKTEWNYPEKT